MSFADEQWDHSSKSNQSTPPAGSNVTMKRPLDVVIFGATGDTGSAACRLLYHHATKLHVNTWAPAARNLDKLQKNVLQPLLEAASGEPTWSTPIQADSNDLESLVQMASQAKVVVACAGPYAQYGEKVMAACILAGTHYVDVTGEVDWVNIMSKRYNNAAKERGVSIVSFCGYDSVPMDLSAYLAADALRKSGDSASIIETFATSHTKGGGGVPTGTINTVLRMVNNIRYKFSFGLLGTAPSKIVRVGPEHNGLVTGGTPLLTPRVKKLTARDGKYNGATYRSELPEKYVYSSPHFMAGINMPIVHATAEKMNFSNFQYHERSLSGGRRAWENADGSVLTGYLIPSIMRYLTYLAAAPFVMTPFFERLVWFFVKRANSEGKDERDEVGHNMVQRLMNHGETTGYVGVKGYGKGKKGSFASTNFECDFDAGIGFTMLSALAIAGCLTKKAVSKGENGFQTPVCAVGGETLRSALSDAGVRVSVEVRKSASSARSSL